MAFMAARLARSGGDRQGHGEHRMLEFIREAHGDLLAATREPMDY
jgi:hypothetical protein